MVFESVRGWFSLSKKESQIEKEDRNFLHFFGTGETEQGENHQENEDSQICDHAHQLYAVFDGVSGEEGGRLASEASKKVFENFFVSTSFELEEEKAIKLMYNAIQAAHNRIQKIEVGEQNHSPGTTATVLKFFRNPKSKKLYAVIGNVGDSRVYQKTRDTFRRLTEDHNVHYQEQVEAGNKKGDTHPILIDTQSKGVEDSLDQWEGKEHYVTPEGLDTFIEVKQRNRITSSLGGKNAVPNYVDVLIVKDIFPGDQFFLTSDGVHDNLTFNEIKEVVLQADNPDEIVNNLVEVAHTRSLECGTEGGNLRAKFDDITVVGVAVDKSGKEKNIQPSPISTTA